MKNNGGNLTYENVLCKSLPHSVKRIWYNDENRNFIFFEKMPIDNQPGYQPYPVNATPVQRTSVPAPKLPAASSMSQPALPFSFASKPLNQLSPEEAKAYFQYLEQEQVRQQIDAMRNSAVQSAVQQSQQKLTNTFNKRQFTPPEMEVAQKAHDKALNQVKTDVNQAYDKQLSDMDRLINRVNQNKGSWFSGWGDYFSGNQRRVNEVLSSHGNQNTPLTQHKLLQNMLNDKRVKLNEYLMQVQHMKKTGAMNQTIVPCPTRIGTGAARIDAMASTLLQYVNSVTSPKTAGLDERAANLLRYVNSVNASKTAFFGEKETVSPLQARPTLFDLLKETEQTVGQRDSDVQALLNAQGHHKLPFSTGLGLTGVGAGIGAGTALRAPVGQRLSSVKGRAAIGAAGTAGLLALLDYLLPGKKGLPPGVAAPPEGTQATKPPKPAKPAPKVEVKPAAKPAPKPEAAPSKKAGIDARTVNLLNYVNSVIAPKTASLDPKVVNLLRYVEKVNAGGGASIKQPPHGVLCSNF